MRIKAYPLKQYLHGINVAINRLLKKVFPYKLCNELVFTFFDLIIGTLCNIND